MQYYFLAIYFQSVYGYSVLQTGLAFLPATSVARAPWRASRRSATRIPRVQSRGAGRNARPVCNPAVTYTEWTDKAVK
ncbi:hypothetical protein CAZ07_37365 [Pseudomonas aeruginosa]|nr:hypothetical protein CAZ07_37365 [Pseudomonas aeruginosa]